MINYCDFKGVRLFIVFGVICLTFVFGNASEQKDMGGWELDSPYNKLYNPSEMDKFKAIVVGVKEVVPMPGMAPGVALAVRESEGEVIWVHICPSWYIDKRDIGIRKGDKVKIRGVWVEINGEDVFIASKIKKGDYFELKIRLTSSGKPFWTMGPEELAKEKTRK
jgi:hypothetical protein